MGELKLQFTNIADYLAQEEQNTFKSEYHDGEIIAMAGGTLNHGRIGKNTVVLLDGITKNKGCETYNSDVKIYFDQSNSFVYPDAFVVCGDVATSEYDANSVTNPVLVVEVLSKSTEGYDRGDKFKKYCSLPSFREYVLIAQDKAVVDVLYKNGENDWRMNFFIGLEKSIYLHTLDATIPMTEIYRNITDLVE